MWPLYPAYLGIVPSIIANDVGPFSTTTMIEMFGEDTVPYRPFPTLPAANFPNTEKLYNQLTKQSEELVIYSFEPAVGTDRS